MMNLFQKQEKLKYDDCVSEGVNVSQNTPFKVVRILRSNEGREKMKWLLQIHKINAPKIVVEKKFLEPFLVF